MNELILVESQSARDEFANRIDVLQKVKQLRVLPDDLHVTTQMVADFYEVTQEVIRKVIQLHRNEFDEDKMVVLKGEEYRDYLARDETALANFPGFDKPKIRAVTLLPRRAVLRIGMLLRDSEVAKQVRTYLLNMEHPVEQPIPSSNGSSELTAKADTLRWVAANTKMLLELLPDGTERRNAVANVFAFAGITFPASETRVAEQSTSNPLTLVQSPSKWYSCQAIASRYGWFTINHNPHAQLVGAIIRTFGELRPEVDWKPIYMTQGDGKPDILASQYTERVARLVRETLEKNNWPGIARISGRNYKIQYKNEVERVPFAVIG